MFAEPDHPVAGQQIAVGELVERRIFVRHVGGRIDRRLHHHRHRGGRIAQRHRHHDRQIAARTVAGQDQRRRGAPQFRRRGRDPARRRLAIVGRGRPCGLRRQPIVDRHHRQVQLARHFRGEAGVGVDIADHEPAAVIEDHHRAGRTRLARIEQPRGDRHAVRAGDRQVADHRQLADRRIGHVLHRQIHRARFRRSLFVHLRPGHAVQIIQETAHVGADEGTGGSGVGGRAFDGGIGHAALLSSRRSDEVARIALQPILAR